jgi:predicted RNA-binding Zn-ribbon protein involved in translation (DUF1610 family)
VFLLGRLGTRRLYCHARQQRALDLIRKNRRPSSIPQQGPWRVVLQIQESVDYVPVRRETVLNHQRCERNNTSHRNSPCDGRHPVTNKSDIKTYPCWTARLAAAFTPLAISPPVAIPHSSRLIASSQFLCVQARYSARYRVRIERKPTSEHSSTTIKDVCRARCMLKEHLTSEEFAKLRFRFGMDFVQLPSDIFNMWKADQSSLKCPRCGSPIILAVALEGKGPRLYHCDTCDGFDPLTSLSVTGWLQGELRPPK